MESNRQMNDWIVRYGFLYKKRSSNKQKDKFIQAFLSDVLTIRDDINVIEIEEKKRKYHNIYIGDISNADKIISTYFDTPIVSFGDYYLSDSEKNRNNTLMRIAFESVISLCIGLGILFLLFRVLEGTILTIVLTIFTLVFFYFFNRIVKGRASANTQIRNTSSLILVLSMLSKYKNDKKVAFAVVDGGSTNEVGLVVLRNKIKVHSKLYELDSVGINKELKVKEIILDSMNKKIIKIYPNIDRIGKLSLLGKIDGEVLTRQRQKIENILEEK